MLKEMIEKIEQMAKPELIELSERPYTTRPVFPVLEPKVIPLDINTLTGVVDYIATMKRLEADYMSEVPGFEYERKIIHIKSHDSVDVVTDIYGAFSERQTLIKSKCILKQFKFGQWYDLESFIIAIQTFFIQDDTTAAMLRITGNLAAGTSVEHLDDGITQQVKAKTGIARVENVSLPNPVTLRPYRTFLEIDQPPGLFVFRMRQTQTQGIECAIFEADCGMWQLTAIQSIYEWLKERVNDVVEIIR